MSMPIYWYFSVLFAKKVSQSFASLVVTVAAVESAIGLTISLLLFGSEVLLLLIHNMVKNEFSKSLPISNPRKCTGRPGSSSRERTLSTSAPTI
jgi:hypothetical protein